MFLFCAGIWYISCFTGYGQEREGEDSPGENTVLVNPDTGYQVRLEDKAGLLSDEELLDLSRIMEPITAYGNAAFVTVDINRQTTENFARDYYREWFGTGSGTLFVIDMDNRNIWIHSDGAVYRVITKSNANTITDNIYRYASRGDYYGCAREGFEEIYALLEGQRIAQPMKYISNAFLAAILALLINFGLVIGFTGLRRPGKKEILANIRRKFSYSGLRAEKMYETKVYDPVSDGSHGDHGDRGGDGGGGGRSGGGGGHGF